nr:claw keratin-like isoform X2 [Pelodiscus sinensis]|eukprot:XP_025044692.1 claw keratin-like isoform X2 [Pelodiscus sinensis]
MACSSLYYPECGVARPSPVSGTCNEPCVRQCPDSEVVIRPSPIAVTIPGPIMSTFPQQSEVAALGAPVVGSGYGGSFGAGALSGYGAPYGGYYGLGGFGGYGGRFGYGGLCGYGGGYGYGRGFGGLCGYGGGYGYGGACGTGVSCHRYLSGSCTPC